MKSKNVSIKSRFLARGLPASSWINEILRQIIMVKNAIYKEDNETAISLYKDIRYAYYEENDNAVSRLRTGRPRRTDEPSTTMLKEVKTRIGEIEPMIIEIEELNPHNITLKSVENVEKFLEKMDTYEINEQTLLHSVIFDLPGILGNYEFATKSRGWKLGYQAEVEADLQKAILLISKGADPNIRDQYGRTPLHYASKSDANEINVQKINLLLENGSDKYIKDDEGKTPLDYESERWPIKGKKLKFPIREFALRNLIIQPDIRTFVLNNGTDEEIKKMDGKSEISSSLKEDLERRAAILNRETKINKIKNDAIIRDILNRQKLF